MYIYLSKNQIHDRMAGIRLANYNLFFIHVIFGSVFIACLSASTSQDACQQDVNCFLPQCFCSKFNHPMNRSEIPQMVYFAFDDVVHVDVSKHYDYLFLKNNFTNPNGCPISITLFVSDKYTNYSMLKKYHQLGFELGVHSVTHSKVNTGDKVRKEAEDQRNYLIRQAGVSKEDIIGWRSPFLITAGDQQIDALKQLGLQYDISLIYQRAKMDDDDLWPFTMDYGWPFECLNNRCPKQNHKGFWQVPVNAMIDYKHEGSCTFVDGCYNKPNNEDEAYKFIMDNFYSHYRGNKSPFGFNMHASWFETVYLRDAMEKALRDINQYDDVYIVNIKQMLEWMRYPTKLSDIKTFDGLGCWPYKKTTYQKLLWVIPLPFVVVLVCILFVYAFRKIYRKIKNKNYVILKDNGSIEKLVNGSEDFD
ncbi:uncharacterized protein LOC110459274 [Mizuhopecten yessoensis]|uniref:NodB homology domain-containing protein n=1 Tax=Mizuhopecten yessoensis TaxID=6573 RepID=A0A210Q4W5_MIZYE|nr:uncharacterized protein LOC110459274 [Mizuhopecten yessoensis]OWF43786.1 hypothetical protein KP79_PYT12623 [Mizuhopecten yessoensis]